MQIKSDYRIKRILVSLFWFVIVAFISYRMPLFSDDLIQNKSYVTGGDIENFGMILPSVVAFYNTINGRFISFFFIQLMLYLPRIVFALVNAAVYVILINVCGLYVETRAEDAAGDRGEIATAVTGLIFAGFWFMVPYFAEVITWPSGCINYLWMNCVVLTFGLLYYKDFCEPDTQRGMAGFIRLIGYVVLGFCAGLSAEASAAALIFALILYVIYRFRHHTPIAYYRMAGIIACIIGYGFLVLAPGAHAKGSSSAAASETGSFIVNYAHRIGRETFYTILLMAVPVAIFLVLYIISGRKLGIRSILSSIICGKEFFFVLIALASIYVMTFASGFAGRIYQFPLLLVLMAGGISFTRVYMTLGAQHKAIVLRAVSILCVILMVLALIEVVAGTLYAGQSGSFFDRQMFYYHIEDPAVSGLLPGDGVTGVN